MKTLRAAIIGCGGIHHVHAKTLADIPGVELTAVCDTKPERAEASAKAYGARAYTRAEDIYALPDVDVVHITTPHYLHAAMTISALQAGKYVLCEKPMATSCADAKAMIAASGGRLGIIFQNRYNAASERLKQIVTGGEYGALICIRGQVTWIRTPDYYSDDWHGRKALEGGGVMMNQAIHTLDLVQWLAGPALTVTGQINTQALTGVIEVEDTAQFRIRFANGAIGIFYATTGYGVDDEIEVEVVMEKGVFWLRGDQLYRRPHGQELEMICRNERLIPKGKDYWGTGHLKQIADYYDAIRNNRPIRIDGREGYAALSIVQALYRSAEAGGVETAIEQL